MVEWDGVCISDVISLLVYVRIKPTWAAEIPEMPHTAKSATSSISEPSKWGQVTVWRLTKNTNIAPQKSSLTASHLISGK